MEEFSQSIGLSPEEINDAYLLGFTDRDIVYNLISMCKTQNSGFFRLLLNKMELYDIVQKIDEVYK